MTETATTQAIDDVTALCLLVTKMMNMDIAEHDLPEAIAVQGALYLKSLWAARGLKPENTTAAALYYATIAWGTMSEVDRVRWLGLLIRVCDGDQKSKGA